jgi:hypothetical protein
MDFKINEIATNGSRSRPHPDAMSRFKIAGRTEVVRWKFRSLFQSGTVPFWATLARIRRRLADDPTTCSFCLGPTVAV